MENITKESKILNIILWIAQGILAMTFIWASMMKLYQSADKLAVMWPWTADNITLVKITGIIDLFAGVGIILPVLLRIQPKLTIYAAYGIILLMVCASIFHLSRGEISQIGINIFCAALAVFIAWGRLNKSYVE